MSLDINYVPRGNYPCYSWSKTLVELSVEGKLDRQRLLSASLGGLQRNTDVRNTGWFHKFHELLQPTTEERQDLQSTYLQLLSHPVSGVVGMALDALAVLQKAKRLDLPGFLEAVGPVFYLQPKAQPLAAVKLLGRAAAHKEHLPKLAKALLSGLSHPAVQVQEAIIKLLDKMRDQVTDVITAALPTQVECLAPSLQERARKLFVDESAAPSATTSIKGARPASEVIEQARQIPSPWREMAGIDSLLRAIDETGAISAVSFDPMAVPRLYPDQRVQPIATLDELIERLTVAVEGLDDVIEFELLVDGLSRLCDQRPEHFEAHVAPLLRRIEKLMPVHPSIPLTMTAGGLRIAIFKLVLHWCDRDLRRTHVESDAIFGFLDVRVEIVAERIRNRQAAPLLAFPTHRQGWIDPREMASRLDTYQRLEQEPAKNDFVQGLLRLAPDGRLETLAEAAALRGEYAGAFRYALGGPLEKTALPSAVFIAAGRARTPFADLTEPQPLTNMGDTVGALTFGLKSGASAMVGKLLRVVSSPFRPNTAEIKCASTDMGGPDALHPAQYSWQVNHSGADSQTLWAKLYVNVKPDVPLAERIRDLPATLIHTWRYKCDFAWDGQTGLNRWLATVWPVNLDSYFSLGAKIRSGRFSEVSVLRQRATFLGPLFDPNVPFTEMAQLLLVCCLNEQAPEVTGLAVDALVELIRDGRCVGTELGDVLRQMMPYDFIKLNRLAKHLETAARASQLHAHVCGQIVQTACAHLTEARKDLHHLFGPLLEWLSALEQGVSDGLRPMLEQLTSGKTGELARKLLALHGTPNKRPALLLEVLQGRLQRAEKWAAGGVGNPHGSICAMQAQD